ncbi:hypothetical protein MMC24_004955 [Lignoscripta atroalba]|nr:hypothetical protein [Lignoscripta atroalba]
MPLTFALQALLARHETCMAEAEEERQRMATSIDRLETDKRALKAANAALIEENRSLLDQVEDLNNTVSESDTHIQSLTTTLQSTRQELQRLTVLAGRTAQLEAQLLAMETEHSRLELQLASSEEDNRSTVQRWTRAERTIEYLQEQVNRTEKDAKEERERHAEVVGRLERRRSVGKELKYAGGRLEGAATLPSFGRDKAGNNVVSHFVKDILQDNANLQMGIVELREMLLNANEEVENLRERMMLHQPLALADEVEQMPTLKSELKNESLPEALSELHVHHHYHTPVKPEVLLRERIPLQRRPKKKRVAVTPGLPSPHHGTQTPGPPWINGIRRTTSSSTATFLSQTPVTIPPNSRVPSHRWSMQSSQSRSSFAPSSIPSSPQSTYQSSSGFDCIDSSLDPSRPTSPECSSVGSPMFFPQQKLGEQDVSSRRVSTPASFSLQPAPLEGITETLPLNVPAGQYVDQNSLTDFNAAPTRHPSVPEESETDIYGDSATPGLDTDSSTSGVYSPMEQVRPHLRRSASHESVLSVSGMDIHTTRNRPSQIFTGQGFTSRTAYSISSPSTTLAAGKPVISPTIATGRPISHRQGYDSSNYNRSLLSGVATPHTRPRQELVSPGERPTLGKRVGGWVWGKWGVSPTASTGNLRAKVALSAIDERASGVNQSGPIKGMRPPVRTPSNVEAVKVDTNSLQESLGE